MGDVPTYHLGLLPPNLLTRQQLRRRRKHPVASRAPDGYLFDELSTAPVAVPVASPALDDASPSQRWASEILADPHIVVLAVRCTGAGRIILIAIVLPTGEVLLDTLVNPEGGDQPRNVRGIPHHRGHGGDSGAARLEPAHSEISKPSTELSAEGCTEDVGLGGLEPPTSSLSAKRSNRLSYRPVRGWDRCPEPRAKITRLSLQQPKPLVERVLTEKRPGLLGRSGRVEKGISRGRPGLPGCRRPGRCTGCR